MTDNKIDIDDLTEDELLALNHQIVERLKFLESYRTHQEMMRFSPGDKVSFQPPGKDLLMGTLIKYNKKTVTVMTETGQRWNVSPHLLTPVENVKKTNTNHSAKVIELPRKGSD